MDAVSTSVPDSSDSHRVNDLMEKYTDLSFGQVKNGAEGARMPCVTRTFENLTSSILSATNLDSDFEVLGKVFGPNHGVSGELMKLEPEPWVEISDSSMSMKNSANLENFPETCKFVKNEREPTRSEFHLTPDVNQLDVCTSSITPCHSPRMDSTPGLMVDLNPSSAPASMTQLGFEQTTSNTPPVMCKSEVGSWDSQLWFQAALNEERPAQVGFSPQDIISSSGFIQRSTTFYSSLPG